MQIHLSIYIYAYLKVITHTYVYIYLHSKYTTKSKCRNLLSCIYVYIHECTHTYGKQHADPASTILRHRCTPPSHASDMNLGSGTFFFSLGLKKKLSLGIMGGKWVLTCLPNHIPCQDHYVEKHWWSGAWAQHKRVLIFIMSIYIWGAFMMSN